MLACQPDSADVLVEVNVSVVGSYSSALCRALEPLLAPPARKISPFSSSVAVCCHRGVVIVWLVAANESFGVAGTVGVAVGVVG